MPLIQSNLQISLANFMENGKNYPRSTRESAKFWAKSLKDYLKSGNPKSSTLNISISNFEKRLLVIFSRYYRTAVEFANNIENAIHQLYLELLPGFLPKFQATKIKGKPNIAPIFIEYSRTAISSRLAIEIHKLFFLTELLDVEKKTLNFFR